jgi:hypothetical protein
MEKSGTKWKINPIKSIGGIAEAALQAGGRRLEICSIYINKINALEEKSKVFYYV